MYHFDNTGDHNSEDDMSFVKTVSWAWELLHKPPTNARRWYKQILIFMQKEKYKCGFYNLQNIEMYCHGIDIHVDSHHSLHLDVFKEDMVVPFNISMFQI